MNIRQAMKVKQYTVVHSKDPWLLARLSTDLMLEGFTVDESWSKTFHPFKSKGALVKWCLIKLDGEVDFHVHPCRGTSDNLFTITESNYIEALIQILEKFKETKEVPDKAIIPETVNN